MPPPAAGVTLRRFTGCGNGIVVQLITVEGGVHRYMLPEPRMPTARLVLDLFARFLLP
ncbi:MAG: hypothetical protein HY909_22855 [Deltaproteobacteria bacterium]|nr:hypothetical protein [Deltaproteobacteria bacterium]